MWGLRWILLAILFVCPLLFFTDLTRNPYITQITLLNIGILAAVLWIAVSQTPSGEWRMPRTPLDIPIAAWLGLCVLSWGLSYLGHVPFYRDAMRAEGLRVFLFTVVNCVGAYYLGVYCMRDCPEEPRVPVARWALFAVLWGGLWFLFPGMRSPGGAVTDMWPHLFDPFGALLWAGGLCAVIWLGRSGSAHAFWHAALTVGFLSAAYGICQYFSIEIVWPKLLDPYGGRSVSTFGNPNFMSSYLVMLLPLGVVYYLHAKSRLHRGIYAALLLTLEAGLLCSLTRSSWVGAAAAAVPLLLSRRLRRLARQDMEFHGLVLALVLLIAMFWPQSNVEGYRASMVGRITEIGDIFRKSSAYSPWHQRLMIWLCSWTMGSESPLLGNGWGSFELFYPFYQGHFLNHIEIFRALRTHANNAHNEIMEYWAQLGIAGVGVLFWTWIVFFRSLWQTARPPRGAVREEPKAKPKGRQETAPDHERVWALAAGAGVLGMLTDNLLNVSLHFAVPGFFFWWQAGAAMTNLPDVRERVLRFRVRALAYAAAAAVLGAVLWASWQHVRIWNREVRYFMGFKLMRRQDVRRALGQLELAYRWHPREVNTNYELGNAYAKSRRIEKAVWAYHEALKANAGYDEIYFNLATMEKGLGRREDALRDYQVSWAINPLSHPLYVSFTQFLLEKDPQKNRDLLIRLLERAVVFFPEDIHFLNNLGYLYSLGHEFRKAEDIYVRVLKLDPDMVVAERNLRTSLNQSGRPEPEVLKRVEDLRRLEARLRRGLYDAESYALARRVTDAFPSSLQAKFYLGNLALMRGDSAEAERLLLAVIRREPNNKAAHLNLAQLYRKLGRREEAAEQYQAVLSIDPGDKTALEALKSIR